MSGNEWFQIASFYPICVKFCLSFAIMLSPSPTMFSLPFKNSICWAFHHPSWLPQKGFRASSSTSWSHIGSSHFLEAETVLFISYAECSVCVALILFTEWHECTRTFSAISTLFITLYVIQKAALISICWTDDCKIRIRECFQTCQSLLSFHVIHKAPMMPFHKKGLSNQLGSFLISLFNLVINTLRVLMVGSAIFAWHPFLTATEGRKCVKKPLLHIWQSWSWICPHHIVSKCWGWFEPSHRWQSSLSVDTCCFMRQGVFKPLFFSSLFFPV